MQGGILTPPRGVDRLAAYNERRQFASLNRGPTLATPQRRPLQGSPQKSAHSRFYYADSLIGIQ